MIRFMTVTNIGVGKFFSFAVVKLLNVDLNQL